MFAMLIRATFRENRTLQICFLQPLFEMTFSVHTFPLGLIAPVHVACIDAACDGKLIYDDATEFDFAASAFASTGIQHQLLDQSKDRLVKSSPYAMTSKSLMDHIAFQDVLCWTPSPAPPPPPTARRSMSTSASSTPATLRVRNNFLPVLKSIKNPFKFRRNLLHHLSLKDVK